MPGPVESLITSSESENETQPSVSRHSSLQSARESTWVPSSLELMQIPSRPQSSEPVRSLVEVAVVVVVVFEVVV